jgi:hypothetical protein
VRAGRKRRQVAVGQFWTFTMSNSATTDGPASKSRHAILLSVVHADHGRQTQSAWLGGGRGPETAQRRLARTAWLVDLSRPLVIQTFRPLGPPAFPAEARACAGIIPVFACRGDQGWDSPNNRVRSPASGRAPAQRGRAAAFGIDSTCVSNWYLPNWYVPNRRMVILITRRRT